MSMINANCGTTATQVDSGEVDVATSLALSFEWSQTADSAAFMTEFGYVSFSAPLPKQKTRDRIHRD